MNSISCLIKDLLYFGPYPNEEILQFLESRQALIVDLTTNMDNLAPYKTGSKRIHYPIVDGEIPTDSMEFFDFLTRIILKLYQQTPIYIHCKGGHGRSGMVSACVLWGYFNVTPKKAIELVTISHRNRLDMKNKWRRVKCPHSFKQRDWVYKFSRELINPIVFNDSSCSDSDSGRWGKTERCF